jgi:DNA-binding NarL/FixJ family response regulator
MSKIKIGIADDHALFRKGMISMISSIERFIFTLEAEDGRDLLNLLKSEDIPDIIILDLRMPNLNGIETLKILKKEYPNIKIVFISVHDDQDIIEHLFEIGANAYLNKNSNPEEVFLALENVFNYDFHFNPAAKLALKEIERSNSKKKFVYKESIITRRESEILSLICQELTNSEIANKLDISQRTVESHRVVLLNKSSSRNTAGLVLFAIKNNVLSTADLKIRN